MVYMVAYINVYFSHIYYWHCFMAPCRARTRHHNTLSYSIYVTGIESGGCFYEKNRHQSLAPVMNKNIYSGEVLKKPEGDG